MRFSASLLALALICAGDALGQGATEKQCLSIAANDCDLLVAGKTPRPRAPLPVDAGYPCDFSTPCVATDNLLTVPEDFANAAWEKYGAGVAAPTVSASTTTTVDGQTLAYNRIQFAAVGGGQESTVYQNVSSGACKNITCTYSIYIRSHPGAAVPTGNFPIGAASGGGDGQNYQFCPFTTAWSRCELTVVSAPTHGFSYWWMGYVASQSGTSAALDLDLGGPKAEYGEGGATAYQCPSPLQVAGVPAHTGYVQGQIAADWGINSRDGAGMVRVADGTLVLLGGWKGSPQAEWSNDGGANVTTNQIYKSTTNGATWTAVYAHNDDPPQTGGSAMWRRRHSHCAFTATISATEYIYVIGGDGFDSFFNSTGDGVPPYPGDVWRAPAATYGASGTWTRMAVAAEWANTGTAVDGGLNSRVLHSCWADDSGNIYVAGGQTNLTSSTVRNDVWKSTNGGTSFTSLGNAPWPGRGTIASPLPRLNGKTYLYGGEVYDVGPAERIYYNDVWVFDDTSWTSVQPDAGFSPRGYHSVISWQGRLWLLKGYPGENHADIWSSAEPGACWRRERAVAGSAEHAASVSISSDGGFLVISGSSTGLYVSSLRAPP